MDDFLVDFILLGSIIRKFREQDGRSQLQFALDANLGKSFYGRVENGEHKISVETLARISYTLNVPMYRILDEYDHKYKKMYNL